MFEGMKSTECEHEGTLLRGYIAGPEGDGPFPAVLVTHSAIGITHKVDETVAQKLANQGHIAVCTDMYGAHLEVGAARKSTGPLSPN